MSLQLSSALALILLVGACRPPELPTDSLPSDLRVSIQLDSTITVDDQDSFSQLSPVGQGPKGALIRSNWKSSVQSRSFTTYTYDDRNRLVGTFDYTEGYGQQIGQQAHYRGGYLANVWTANLQSPPRDFLRSQVYLESLKKDLNGLQPSQIVKYQYNERKQIARILSYQRISGTNNFKLYRLTNNEYTYGSTGQIQQTRATTYPSPGPTATVYHYQKGDIIREEAFYPRTDISSSTTVTTTYQYGQELDPFTRLTFAPSDSYQSQHNRVSLTDNTGKVTQFVYTYQYDSQGRLISQVIGDEKGIGYWSGYTFE